MTQPHAERPRRRGWPRILLRTIAALVILFVPAGFSLWLIARDALGGTPEGARRASSTCVLQRVNYTDACRASS